MNNVTTRPRAIDLCRSVTDILADRGGDLDEWIYPGLLCDSYTMIYGRAKHGKSTLARAIAVAFSKGESILGIEPVKKPRSPKVLILTTESNGEAENARETLKLEISSDDVYVHRLYKEVPEHYYEAAEDGDFGLVVLDNIKGACRGVGTKDDEFVDALAGVVERFNLANVPVLLLHHAKKNTRDPQGSISGSESITGFARHLVHCWKSKNGELALTGWGNLGESHFSATLDETEQLTRVVAGANSKPANAKSAAEKAMALAAKALPGGLSKTQVYQAVADELKKQGFKNNRGKDFKPDSIRKSLEGMNSLRWDPDSGYVGND